MIEAMPRTLPYLYRERTRHGKLVWYVRRERHGKRVRIDGEFGSREFIEAYHAALADQAPVKAGAAVHGTLGWLITEYLASPTWRNTARETRKQLTYQFDRLMAQAATVRLSSITSRAIVEGRDRRAATPSDANKFLRAMNRLMSWAVERQLIENNPAKGIAKLRLPNADVGFHTWTEDECAAYEDRWPVGTRERLAFDILLYTGFRRGDAVRLGRQHVKDGIARIRSSKTGEDLFVPILPPLAESILATKTGDMAFLITAKGTPFGKEAFGTWFRKACQAAGVPGSAHGLRKAGAVRAAEGGATETQLNALFGWAEGSRESATYTRKANRAKQAKDAARLLIKPRTSEDGAPHLKKLR